jgi:LysM repeat protein
MMTRKIVFGLILAFIGSGLYSCTNYKRVEGTDASGGKKIKVKKSASQYTVRKGDSLWNIAGSKYGDSYQWPLIFKANRDLVEDPDIIEPSQDLQIQKGFTDVEKERARELSSKTPKYVPHSQPRKTLPLNYF